MHLLRKCLFLILPISLFAAPSRPSNLTFSNVTNHSVVLHWNDNSSIERGYKIYRDNVLIAITNKDVQQYMSRGLASHRSYHFTVKATDDNIIKTQQNDYDIDQYIRVELNGMPGNNSDWVGIFDENAPNTKADAIVWKSTDGITNGNLFFNGLPDRGTYQVRAFYNNSSQIRAAYTFTVDGGATPNGGLIINEVMASNGHTILDPDFSDFSDWIELYNGSNQSIDISGYNLSNDIHAQAWNIPSGTTIPANGYLLIWADKEDTSKNNLHTNFKLSSKGDEVALYNRNGQLIDSLVFSKQTIDISCVHNNNSVGFTAPSPKANNNNIINSLAISDKPTFSKSGGFYNGSQSISLSNNSGNIYYTTDGSYPTIHSTRYTHAINLNSTKMLKAISVESGKLPSATMTNTYFINESSTLPVVSLTTDDDFLFDNTIGIYAIGTNGADKVCGGGKANYMQDWKRPANIEYYDKNKNLGFNQEVTISMSGTCSRERGEKSFSVKADKKYGKKEIAYKLFADKDINKFKSIKLRNAGQDWHKGMMRDAMIQKLLKDSSDLDYEAYQPTLLFLNGEYWGIYNIREKKNEDYLAANHPGLDDKKVDILYGPNAKVKEGSNTEYKALISYLNSHSLTSSANYNYVADRVDIDDFIDYHIIETYAGNGDWLYNNVRFYKEQKAGAKWRWILDDLDSGFDLYRSDPDEFGLNHNTIGYALSYPTEDPNDSFRNRPAYTILFRKLMENNTFKNKFITRYKYLLDHALSYNTVSASISDMRDAIDDEMSRHIQRWTNDSRFGYTIGYSGKSNWIRYVGYLDDFAHDRPSIIRTQIHDMFGQ